MATPENTEGRFQQIDLALAEIRDDAAKNAADQGHNNVDLIGKIGLWPHDWEFPKGGETATEGPCLSSWAIRIREVLERDEATGEEKVVHKREIFSPLWRTKDATHVAKGCLEGAWSDLPDNVKIGKGTLYAVLKITISAGTYEPSAFDLTLTTDISSISDTPVVPPDPSSSGGSGTDGIYHLIVPIGRFSGSADDGGATGFEQWHVGVIAEDFMPRRPASGGGGGDSGSLALGPIVEYENAYAQYIGKWVYDSESNEWTFSRTNDTPAIVYEKQRMTVRDTVQEGSSSSDALSVVDTPKLIKNTSSVWLKMTTTNVFKNFSYTPPSDETGTGGMDAQGATISFLGSATDDASKRILETVVEDANEQTTYEATETQAESEVV